MCVHQPLALEVDHCSALQSTVPQHMLLLPGYNCQTCCLPHSKAQQCGTAISLKQKQPLPLSPGKEARRLAQPSLLTSSHSRQPPAPTLRRSVPYKL